MRFFSSINMKVFITGIMTTWQFQEHLRVPVSTTGK